MKPVYLIVLPHILSYSAYAAYLSFNNHADAWTGLHDLTPPTAEGLLFSPPLHDPESHYLCDVVIGTNAYEISFHPESPGDWKAASMNERNIPQEYVALINQHLKSASGLSGLPTSTSGRAHYSPLAHSPSHMTPPKIRCRGPIESKSKSFLHQRIGFMNLIDLLSIVGVGLLAAFASGIAALLRRRDHLQRPTKVSTAPGWDSLNHFRESPIENLDETEQMLRYIKSKLG